jgi:hypothetical protein
VAHSAHASSRPTMQKHPRCCPAHTPMCNPSPNVMYVCVCVRLASTGGGRADAEPCDICPVGTFSPGYSRDRCIPCGFGYTSPVGAKEERDCYPIDQCPAGTGMCLPHLLGCCRVWVGFSVVELTQQAVSLHSYIAYSHRACHGIVRRCVSC